MAKSCKCVEDFKVSARDHLGNGVHSDIYMKTIFNSGKEYFWMFKDKMFYVTDEQKYLRRSDYYNIHIEVLDMDTFFDHFEITKKK